MFHLTGNLWKEEGEFPAPAFRVWQPEAIRKIPPAFAINYINYHLITREAIVEWIPEPPLVNGYWGEINLNPPTTIEEVSAENYASVFTPYWTNQIWISQDRRSLYLISPIPDPTLTITLKLNIFPDLVTSKAVQFTLPLLGLALEKIEVAGLTIVEFTQSGNLITLPLSPQIQLDYESGYLFTLTGELTFGAKNAASIFKADFENIDQFEYMGGGLTQNFIEGDVAVGKFIFDENKKILVAFLGQVNVPRAQQEFKRKESGLASENFSVIYQRPAIG